MGTQVNPVRAHRSPRLNELNDSCLKHILDYLDPLPDRFSLAVTCRVRPSFRGKGWMNAHGPCMVWSGVTGVHRGYPFL